MVAVLSQNLIIHLALLAHITDVAVQTSEFTENREKQGKQGPATASVPHLVQIVLHTLNITTQKFASDVDSHFSFVFCFSYVMVVAVQLFAGTTETLYDDTPPELLNEKHQKSFPGA